jgi:hypothetical protein
LIAKILPLRGDVSEDFFKHQFTGGTHPIDIHEYIARHDPNVDLGYQLVLPEANARQTED